MGAPSYAVRYHLLRAGVLSTAGVEGDVAMLLRVGDLEGCKRFLRATEETGQGGDGPRDWMAWTAAEMGQWGVCGEIVRRLLEGGEADPFIKLLAVLAARLTSVPVAGAVTSTV